MVMRLRAAPTRITRISIGLYTLRGLLHCPACVCKEKENTVLPRRCIKRSHNRAHTAPIGVGWRVTLACSPKTPCRRNVFQIRKPHTITPLPHTEKSIDTDKQIGYDFSGGTDLNSASPEAKRGVTSNRFLIEGETNTDNQS